MQPHLIFRVHSDLRLGLGHVARALAIASVWKTMGGIATIAVSGDKRAKLIAAGKDPFSESVLTCSAIYLGDSIYEPIPDHLKSEDAVALLDLWDATQDQVKALRPLKVAIMEDNGDAHECADLLFQPYLEGINWNNNPRNKKDKKPRPCEEQRNGCRVLKGADYIVLSSLATHLHTLRKQIQPLSVKKLLVTFGGTDGAHLAPRAFDVIKKIIDENGWDGQCTLLAPEGVAIKNAQGITVLPIIPNLTLHLPEFDAIWCAGGVTLAECLFLGIPVAAWSQNERQQNIISEIALESACINLGLGPEAGMTTVQNSLTHWLGPLGQESRQEQSANGMNLVDGSGATRVAQELWALTKRNTSFWAVQIAQSLETN